MEKKLVKKIRWGVAGCGRITENSFVPAVNQLKKSSLAAVYSHNLKRARFIASKTQGAKAFDDFDEFLAADFDALYVASANDDHYEQVLKAAKAGKHILCEKPLAMTAEQAEEMVRVCKENNVQFAVNYIFRFHPLLKKAKELIENRYVGQVVSISANFHIDFPPSDNYRYSREKGGGALRDLGTHMIDTLRYLGGEFAEIHGYMDRIVYKTEVDDFAGGIVKFESGYYGGFQVSFNSRRAPNRIVIIGHNGTISIEDLIGKKFGISKLIIDIDGERRVMFRRKANKFLTMLRSVQKSFMKNETPEVTGEDGSINMRIIEEIEKQNNLQ